MRRRILFCGLIALGIVGMRVASDLYTGNDLQPVLDLLGELVSTAPYRSVLIGLVLAVISVIALSILLPVGVWWLLMRVSDDTKAERAREKEARRIEDQITSLGGSPPQYRNDRPHRPRIDG